MAAIKLTGFIGEQPLIKPHLLPDTAAQDAYDLRLDDGGLTPIRQPVQVDTAGSATDKSIVRFDGEWLSFAGTVHAVPGPVADDRLYFTGDGVPKMRVAGEIYDLAVPAPTAALGTAVSGTGTGNVATRLYVYTFVTAFGEESEPSAASAETDWQSGQTVTLSGFEAAPAGRNITKQRIYRSQTGEVGTYLYFIAERDVSSSDFLDDIAVDAFNEPLPSADWTAPPDGLSGIISLPNGMMAAFVGRDLYFCEPWRPHAWPEKYVLTTDYPIVALGAVGSVLIVMTEGQPYYVSGSHPSVMRMEKIERNLPCINPRAVVDLGYAIAYPSRDGLVVIGGDVNPRIVTANLFNRDKWLSLSPSTAVASQISGRYVMFYDTVDAQANVVAGALFIDVGGTPYLLRSSVKASAVWYDLTASKLYFLKLGTNDICEFDPSTGSAAIYSWRSKEFRLTAPTNFGVVQVDADSKLNAEEVARIDAEIEATRQANATLIAAGPINGEMNSHVLNAHTVGGDMLAPLPDAAVTPEITIFADGTPIASIDTINRPVRLPSGFLARSWEVAAKGRTSISQILLGHTLSDLKQVV
jgi:hypothetical protein